MIPDLSRDDRYEGMNPLTLGRDAFLLRHWAFYVIDGDTIAVKATHDREGQACTEGRRPRAYSIRFRSIAAPERPKRRSTDRILTAAGIDPHWDSAGRKATGLLKTYLERRALLVQPTGSVDKHGRMLADMAVVPIRAGEPDVAAALSLERLMLQQGVVGVFRDEPLPPLRPQLRPTEASFEL